MKPFSGGRRVVSKSAMKKKNEHRANFLWPCEDGTIEEAGYEFANGLTEEYRQHWWEILYGRIAGEAEGGES